MERILCLCIGYVFGLFQTAYIYGRLHHIDIREHGSGNAGTTNALRVLGKKAGIIVYIGDFLKCAIACGVTRLIFSDSHPNMIMLLVLYTGLGVVLGHNFPFYLKFKGGKGIAVTSGVVFATFDWRIWLVCLLAFVISVVITKYVSVGSLVMVTLLTVMYAVFAVTEGYGLPTIYVYESIGVVCVLMLLAFVKHKANIIRLLHGEENKIGASKQAKNS